MHESKPNELLLSDFCYIMPAEGALGCVLVLTDDFSGFVWLSAAAKVDANKVASALLHWFSFFGTGPMGVSDQKAHFKIEPPRKLRKFLKSEHHFTMPDCPWGSGAAKVVCGSLLRKLSALLCSCRMPQRCLAQVLFLVQSIVKKLTLSDTGNRSPLTVFKGTERRNYSALGQRHRR